MTGFALDFTMDFVLCSTIAVLAMLIALIVKLMWNINGAGDGAAGGRNMTSATESNRLLSSPEVGTLFGLSYYGTIVPGAEEDSLESGKLGFSRSSPEDFYEAKMCLICYDEQRNCFFVPCGHCISCIHCANRIMSGEIKSCPICRTFINKVAKMRLCESNAL